ncbi:MAG: hypothetical protein ACOYOU_17645 [Kiritimatiellia bacterium]
MDTIKLVMAAREVVAHADNTGCDAELTVTSGPAVGRLNMALRPIGELTLIAKPLSAAQVKKLAKDGRLTVRIPLDIDELSVGKDCLNDAVSRMVTGDESALEDISYEPVGIKDAQVVVEVDASVVEWLAKE